MEKGQTQIAFGTTAEQMKALYFNATTLKDVAYKLYQLNSRGERYYYTFGTDGEPIFFPSVTTVLHKVAPENRVLTEWKLRMGKEAADNYTNERASYGTFIHGLIEQLVISRKFNLEEIKEKLEKYVEREKLPYGFVESHIEEAKADMIAFAKWMRDYDVRPIAVEVALYSPTMGVAGMIDLVADIREYPISKEEEMVAKASDEAGKRKAREKYGKRIYAIIDFKSGKKGFYDSYAQQLEIYRRMWNETFPELPISRMFNIAPKEWMGTAKKVPSYNYEEQTDNPAINKVDPIFALFACEEEQDKKIVNISGTIDLNEAEGNNVQVYNLAELVKENRKKIEKAESAEDEIEEF